MQGNGGRKDENRQYARLPRQTEPTPARSISPQVRRRKKKIVIQPRFYLFLVAFILLVVGFAVGIRALVKALANTEATITYGMIEDVTTVDSLIIRDETCVRAEGYGTIDVLVPEMTYVAADTPVVQVYASGYSNEMITELNTLMDRITAQQKSDVLGNIIDTTVTEYDTKITNLVGEIKTGIVGKSRTLDTLMTQLTDLMSSRQEYIEKTTAAKENATLSQMYSSKSQLVSRIQAWKTQYKAQGEGIVCYSFDGLEPYLNLDTLDALDVTAVKELLKENDPAVPDELRSQQNLYRLVQPNKWYVAFTTKASTWKIGQDSTCAIYFESMEDITYSAKVRSVEGTGDDVVVILEMSEDGSPLINARKCKAVIGGRVEGMMVPLSSLKTEGSQQGVYLADQSTFVPVRVVGQDSKHALIMPIEDGALSSGTRIKK